MHVRPRQRGRAGRGELLELDLDRLTDALAVLVLEPLERVDVGGQRLARRVELLDLGFDALALALRDPACRRLGLADERLRLRLRLVDELAGACLRVGDGLVGGLLREDQRPLDDVGVRDRDPFGHRGRLRHRLGRRLRNHLRRRLGCGLRRGLHGRGRIPLDPLLQGADLLLQVLDRRGGAFEQLVDVVAVVPAPRLTDLGVTKFLGRYVHDAPC